MVHTFTCLGHSFMLDVESGTLCQIDEKMKNFIDSVSSPSGELDLGEFSRLRAEYPEEAEEAQALIDSGNLYAPRVDFVPPEPDGTIKSMCLNICHNCNLACAYCFADEGKYTGKKASMSVETACRALEFLAEKSGTRRNLEVDFFGGEPLMNMDAVIAAVKYGRELEKTHNKNFRFTITTNAVGLNDEIIDFLNREMYNVVLSIDGRKDVHNRVRKTQGGKDSFDVVLKNALAFRKKRGDAQYYARGTFTSLNKDFAADALALADYGFDKLSLEPVVLPASHPLALKEEDLPELYRQYEILADAYITRRKDPDTWFSFFHFVVDLKNSPCLSKRYSSCGAGTEYVAVTPQGDIYPCHQFVGNAAYKMGNIATGDVDEALYKQFCRNNLAYKPVCRDCWAKYHCSGGCAANAVNFNGRVDAPYKIACALMQKRLECALAIYTLESENE
ncbi:MAG: thioether cross-link-forming SCIFF peptide maturase [Clostridiales bacterium]|nr:thioether cross-link-forming SCIFF peptide maturase [Clostridiales bacterium]